MAGEPLYLPVCLLTPCLWKAGLVVKRMVDFREGRGSNDVLVRLMTLLSIEHLTQSHLTSGQLVCAYEWGPHCFSVVIVVVKEEGLYSGIEKL